MYLLGPRILAIGDSITEDTVTPFEGAYRRYMGEGFSSWFGANVEWVGENDALGNSTWAGTKMCGTSGRRVDQVLDNDDPGGQALRGRPNLVIIGLLTNESTQLNSGSWVGGTEEIAITNYSTLLTTIFANVPSDTIVCCIKIIPNGTAGANTIATSLNTKLTTMVAGHANTSRIFFADCNTAFINYGDWLADLMNDNTHPNSAGKALMGSTILSAIQSNVTLMARTPASFRKEIKPHTGYLSYTASSATDLGNVELNTALPWAVSFELNLDRASHSTSSANGILTLKTDQATCFGWATLPTAGQGGRGWEFGSSANFDRFFPSVAVEGAVYSRFARGWHTHTFVFDGVSRTSDSSYKYYLNRTNVTLTNGSGLGVTADVSQVGRVVFGGLAGTFDMANLTIWNGGAVMSSTQVDRWVNNYEFPSGVTLLRNFPHTDLSGTTLTDTTGAENGVIGTAAWTTTNLPTKARTAASARTAATTRTQAS